MIRAGGSALDDRVPEDVQGAGEIVDRDEAIRRERLLHPHDRARVDAVVVDEQVRLGIDAEAEQFDTRVCRAVGDRLG